MNSAVKSVPAGGMQSPGLVNSAVNVERWSKKADTCKHRDSPRYS